MASYQPAHRASGPIAPTTVYPDAGPDPMPRRSRFWPWVVAILTVITLGMATLLTIVVINSATSDGFTTDEQAALEAAETITVGFLEFDYKDPDATKEALQGKITGTFEAEWNQGWEHVVEKGQESRVTRTVDVIAVALADDASGCGAECTPVLVTVDTTVDQLDVSEPVDSQMNLLMFMADAGGEWKLSEISVTS